MSEVGHDPGSLAGIDAAAEGADDETIQQRAWISPLIGTILLIAILLAGPIYGRLTVGDKVSPDIDRDAAQVNITVDLPFEPESYHRETLSDLGVFAGRDREDTTKLRLRAVTQEDLNTIANFFWVEGIEPG